MLHDAVPQSLQETDKELERLINVLDLGISDSKANLNIDNLFDIAFMSDEAVDRWLRSFGWTYKWMTAKDKRILLKMLPILTKEGGTNTGIRIITRSFGGINSDPKLVEPIIFCPPVSEGFTPSTAYGTLCDDWEYNPQVMDIELPPEAGPNLKALLTQLRPMWMKYRYRIILPGDAVYDVPESKIGISLFPGVILPSQDDMVSGKTVYRKSTLLVHYQVGLEVEKAITTTAPMVAYNGLLLKFTESGALDILQNVDDIQIDDSDFQEETNAVALFAHIFKTGPPEIPTVNRIWNGYSFKASVPESESMEYHTVNITPNVKYMRNEWSPAVSFLEPGITFLDNNIFAQWGNIKVEVG